MFPAWPQLRYVFRAEHVALQISQVNSFWTIFTYPTAGADVVRYESSPDGCSANTEMVSIRSKPKRMFGDCYTAGEVLE